MKQEAKIQQEIYIWFHNNYPKCIIHSVPNGFGITIPDAIPKRYHKTIQQLIQKAVNFLKITGMTPGVSDMVVWLPNGRAVMVEVKTDTGKKSDAQKRIQKKIEEMNGHYILVRSLEDFQQQIKEILCGKI